MKYINTDTLNNLFDEIEDRAKKMNYFFVAGVISELKKYIKEELPTIEIENREVKFDFRFKI